jgi:addiction module HigA family antidote
MDDVTPMHNPPHPGEFITTVYLEPAGLSGRELAGRLGLSPSTVSRLLAGTSRMTPDMAVRLSEVLGRSPQSWLIMQNSHDLWLIRKRDTRPKLAPLELPKVS